MAGLKWWMGNSYIAHSHSYPCFLFGHQQWLNVVVTYEVYRLLRSSRIRKRYVPPTRRTAVLHSLFCYAGGFFISTWTLYKSSKFPLTVEAEYGFVCLPMNRTRAETIFYYSVFLPISFALPSAYVLWCFFDIVFFSKLLPPKGRRRELAIYFFRITVRNNI